MSAKTVKTILKISFPLFLFLIILSGNKMTMNTQKTANSYEKKSISLDTEQETCTAKQDWIIETDHEGSARGGEFSFFGNLIEEGRDCIYTTDIGLYEGTGEYQDQDQLYNIYRLKGGEWELFVSHPPEAVNDQTMIKRLIYDNGYLYYSLLYDEAPGEGGDKAEFIYRIPEQGGKAEELALCYNVFYIYNGKIYYRTVGSFADPHWEYLYWEMEPDGTNKRIIYRREHNENMSYYEGRLFTVGGGCLYAKCEVNKKESIVGVNLKTGDTTYFNTEGEMERIYYQEGYLYIYAGFGVTNKKIYRINVVSGELEWLANCVGEAWVENGFLYYTGPETNHKNYDLYMLNLQTKQLTSKVLDEKNAENMRTIHIETVGGKLIIKAKIYQQGDNGKRTGKAIIFQVKLPVSLQ